MNRSESKKSKSSKSVKIESSGGSGKKRKSSDHHHHSSSSEKTKEKKKSHSSSSTSKSSSSSSSSSTSLTSSSKLSTPSPSSHFLSSLSPSLLPPPQIPSSSSSRTSRSSYSSPSSSTISTAYNNNVAVNNFNPKSDSIGFGSKVMTRSKVYSGTVRSAFYDNVPKLEKLCLQVLMDNYTNITYLGDAPYWLIKPVLEKCTSNQLFLLEDYNPRLTEDDDELWKWHCEKEFRDWTRQEDETWRDLFVRAEQERKRKLEQITRNIDMKEKARGPMRKTQLAFTDPKPPRNVKRILDKKDKGFVKATAPQSVSSNAPGANSNSVVTPAKKTKGLLMKNALKMMQTIRRQY